MKDKQNKPWFLAATIAALVAALVLIASPALADGPNQNQDRGDFRPSQPVSYNLYATDGNWKMADGTELYSYGFVGGRTGETITYLDKGDGAPKPWKVVPPTAGTSATAPEMQLLGSAQFPAPMITCAVGDTVTITLKNLGITNPNAAGNDPHSIHLHGLDVDVANDGVPETSVAATPAYQPAEFSSTQLPPGSGNVVVYMFTPKTAGTYFYHCHQEADIHVDMGMYGALIVYNRGEKGAQSVNSGGGPGSPGSLFGWQYDKDVVLMISDTDANQHFSEGGINGSILDTSNGVFQDFSGLNKAPPAGSFDPISYTPQYWFINQISFPNTIHANTTFSYDNWAAAHHGYDPLITGSVSKKDKVLIRMINMGFQTQPMHIHGFHMKVLGKDQRAWSFANAPGTPTGQGMEVNTITVGSGEEYDLLIDFSVQATTSAYSSGVQSRYDKNGKPVSNTLTADKAIPAPEGAPYIGGPTVHGAIIAPAVPSQIFVFHNHDDYKATNNGVYPGGMFTIVEPLP